MTGRGRFPVLASDSFTKTPSCENVTTHRNVVFVCRTPLFGGAEKHLLDLVERLEAPGLQVVILCVEADPFTTRLADTTRHVRVIQCETTPGRFLGWMTLFRKLRP